MILLLGVSGAIALPFVRTFSRARIVTNVDGVEWKRQKWSGLSRWWLRRSERWAVRYSHEVIADNDAIAEHLVNAYGGKYPVIAYGGDHAVAAPALPYRGDPLPASYALALCRIEPENNVAMILEAFAAMPDRPLVFIGNWSSTEFGAMLKERYEVHPHLFLLDPIYDLGVLRTVRSRAKVYIHGHSAGGTNPSLVEMMHFSLPVLAFDCAFNRSTTENEALYFANARELLEAVSGLTREQAEGVGTAMGVIARRRYTWDAVAGEYFRLLAD